LPKEPAARAGRAATRPQRVPYLITQMDAQPPAVGVGCGVGESSEALFKLPTAHQFGAARAQLEVVADDMRVDGERLIDTVEAKDRGTLEISAGRQSLLPINDDPGLLATGNTGMSLTGVIYRIAQQPIDCSC
jgi:hypothetical protein